MDNLYVGREQSLAKHNILRQYIEPFAFKIVQQWDSLDFVDCFSGPWKNNDSVTLSDTSIGVSLRTLSGVAEKLGHTVENRRIRCIFNEADPLSYALLQKFVEAHRDSYPLLEIKIFSGKFEDNAPQIKAACKSRFQLLFVDPTGWTGFSPEALSLFKGRSTEVIVNMMRSFIARFVSGDHEHRDVALAGLVGEKRARYLIDTGLTIKTVEEEYLRMLRGTLGYKYAGFSPIHNPDKNEIQFNLAYATHHPAGMEVMRQAEFTALTDHDRIRYDKSKDNATPDLFSDFENELEILGPYLRQRKLHLSNAANVITSVVSENPRGLPFDEVAALAQQSLYLKQSEISDVITEMASQGLIKPTWKERNGRKPVKKDLIAFS